MFRVIFVLFSLLVAVGNYQAVQLGVPGYKEVASLSPTSFLVLLDVENSNNGVLSTSYIDPTSNNKVPISLRSFTNGFMLFNVQQPNAGEYYEFNVIINGGSSSDPLNLPGIRYLSLFLVTKQVDSCVKEISKDMSKVRSKIEVSTSVSVVYFVFEGKRLEGFFKCFTAAITRLEYLEKSSFTAETTEGTEDFKKLIGDAGSIELDKLAIRNVYGSHPVHGSPSMLLSSMFSESCYKNSVNFSKLLPGITHQLVSEMFVPHRLVAMFSGSVKTLALSKLLSSLTKGAKPGPAPWPTPGGSGAQDGQELTEKVTNAIRNMGNNIVVKKGSSKDVMRLYVPLLTDDLRSLSSNAHEMIMLIISSRHRTGILNFIFMNDFALKFKVDKYIEHSTIMLYIELLLTPKGKDNVPVIIESIMSYLTLLKKTVISDRVYSEVQHVFDQVISLQTNMLFGIARHYFISHFTIPSKSPSDILHNKLNTVFTRQETDYLISKMSLESVFITISVQDQSETIYSLLFKHDRRSVMGSLMVEPHSDEKLILFKVEDVFRRKLCDLDYSHADIFGLQLPNSEPISHFYSSRSFSVAPFENRVVSLHSSLDSYHKYLVNTKDAVTISHTMAFKSVTTSRFWYSNSSKKRRVKLWIKMSMREWSEQTKKITYPVSSFSIITALHVLTAILNAKLEETMSGLHRLGVYTKFVPSQSYSDTISDPFELYLIVKSPTGYISLVMSEISKLLSTFNATIYGDEDSISNARKLAKEALLRIYSGYTTTEKDVKVVSQIVSSKHCSLVKLGKSLDQEVDTSLVQAVYSSLMSSPILTGLIEGNLTPFQANHVLNVFIESLGHKFFLEEASQENVTKFITPTVYHLESSHTYDDIFSHIQVGTLVLDVSTVPLGYKKLLVEKSDFTSTTSSSSISIMVGELNVENFSRASLIEKALSLELLASASASASASLKDISLFTSVQIITNRFLIVSLSIEAEDLTAESLAKTLDQLFNRSIATIAKNVRSSSYIKKISKSVEIQKHLSNKKLLLSTFDPQKLFINSKNYISSLKASAISSLLTGIETLPRVFILTQKVSNAEEASVSTGLGLDGYTNINDNLKSILNNGEANFT